MFGRSIFGVDNRLLRCGYLLLLAVTVSAFVNPSKGLKLCKRCESSEMAALRDYYDNAGFSRSVSFRQFLTSLLYTMSRFKHMSGLYWELKKLIHRYDDCLVTCGISFSKRDRQMQYNTMSELLIRSVRSHPVQLRLMNNRPK